MMVLPDTIDADTSLHEKTPLQVRILMCMCSLIGIYKIFYMAIYIKLYVAIASLLNCYQWV